MQKDLDKERESKIERVMNATVGMYVGLQGIAGKSLQEIEGLEMRALEYEDFE